MALADRAQRVQIHPNVCSNGSISRFDHRATRKSPSCRPADGRPEPRAPVTRRKTGDQPAL